MKVLVVDDEPLARVGLRRELAQLPGITLVGECGTRADAVEAIVERRPDVVLLDIQLGRGTAFEIIEEIGVDDMPLVIFVTAYDRHALKAFEVHALDYVLKPVDPDRLREALDRAGTHLAVRQGDKLAGRLEDLLAHYPARDAAPVTGRGLQRLVVRDDDRLCFVNVAAVEWIESAGNYVRVHSQGRAYLMRVTMDRITQRLRDFVRVRRSALVNVRAIASLERYAKGMYEVRLTNGAKIISSRYYHAALRELLRRS